MSSRAPGAGLGHNGVKTLRRKAGYSHLSVSSTISKASLILRVGSRHPQSTSVPRKRPMVTLLGTLGDKETAICREIQEGKKRAKGCTVCLWAL